jgi:hypothetical protein
MLTRSAKEEGGDYSPALLTNLIIISDVMQSSYIQPCFADKPDHHIKCDAIFIYTALLCRQT